MSQLHVIKSDVLCWWVEPNKYELHAPSQLGPHVCWALDRD